MNLKEIRNKYKYQILKIASKYKANNIRIFGSVARNEANKDSDIDFLVNFGKGASLLDEAGLEEELKNLLGCKADIISDRAIREEFKYFILKEAQPL